MPEDRQGPQSTLALNTKVEEDFVAPLTAMRGALEILRDFPALDDDERQRFVATALRGCSQLEYSVEQLAASVYAAGQPTAVAQPVAHSQYDERIEILDEIGIIELDFSDFVFTNSDVVNDFYDAIHDTINSTGRSWYFLVNYQNCSVWPEAWVAFAHRGKKVAVNHSLGTVRYDANPDTDANRSTSSIDSDLFGSREAAVARIEELKADQARS